MQIITEFSHTYVHATADKLLSCLTIFRNRTF